MGNRTQENTKEWLDPNSVFLEIGFALVEAVNECLEKGGYPPIKYIDTENKKMKIKVCKVDMLKSTEFHIFVYHATREKDENGKMIIFKESKTIRFRKKLFGIQ